MSSRPARRWARAAAAVAAVAVAAGTIGGPLANSATAHEGHDDGEHQKNIARGVPDDNKGYANDEDFINDLPLPVDEHGWWPGWRTFGDWGRLFWQHGDGNEVLSPDQPDLTGDTFPATHPLISHAAFAAAASDQQRAIRVWSAAEHFCSQDMLEGSSTAVALWANAPAGDVVNFFTYWRAQRPLHPRYGSVHGRLLTVILGSGLRSGDTTPDYPTADDLVDAPDRTGWLRADRDGLNLDTEVTLHLGTQSIAAHLQDRGDLYAADPFAQWAAHSYSGQHAFDATRHGRCPKAVIEWWMWYLVWNDKLSTSNTSLQVGEVSVSELGNLEGSAEKAAVDRWVKQDVVDVEGGGTVYYEGKACPLTWPETISDGYDPDHASGDPLRLNTAITKADRDFWQVAKADIIAFHTLAHVVGCSGSGPLAAKVEGDGEGYALRWWLEVMWQTEQGIRPSGLVAVTWATDLWAGDVGPPFQLYKVRSDVGNIDVVETTWLAAGLALSAFANLAARTAGDWTLAVFSLRPMQVAADTVVAEMEKRSRTLVAVGGNLWRVMIMALIAWSVWQMVRKRKIAGTMREIGLSVLLFTILSATAAFGLGPTLKTVVGVLQAAIGGAATILTPEQGCYVYVPHADFEAVSDYVSAYVSDGGKEQTHLWLCDGGAGAPDGDGLDLNGWGSVPQVLPVVAGTTCLWPAAYTTGVALGGGSVQGQFLPTAAELRLCPLRHLVKETLTIGPVWANNLDAQHLAHSRVSLIPGELSGWSCVMWADRITFQNYASGPRLDNINDKELGTLMAAVAEAYNCGVAADTVGDSGYIPYWYKALRFLGIGSRQILDFTIGETLTSAVIGNAGKVAATPSDADYATAGSASGILGHLHYFGPARLGDTVISFVASMGGLFIVAAAGLVTLVGQLGILVAAGFLPLVAAVAVVPGRPRQWLWRWLRFMTRMLLLIAAPAGVLLVFFHLTNIGTRLGAVMGGPPQLSRMIVVLSTMILTVVIVRTMWKNKTISKTSDKWTEKVREQTDSLAGVERKDGLGKKIHDWEKPPARSGTLIGATTARIAGRLKKGTGEGMGTTVAKAAKAAKSAGKPTDPGKPAGKPAGKPTDPGKPAGKPAGKPTDPGMAATVADAAGKAATVVDVGGTTATVVDVGGKAVSVVGGEAAGGKALTAGEAPAGGKAIAVVGGGEAPAVVGGGEAPAVVDGGGKATVIDVGGKVTATATADGGTAAVAADGGTAAVAADGGTAAVAAAGKAAVSTAAAAVAAWKTGSAAWKTGNIEPGQEGAMKRIGQTAAAAKRMKEIADAATKPIDKAKPGGRLTGAAAATHAGVRTWQGEAFKDARKWKTARGMLAEQQAVDKARKVDVELATAAASADNIGAVTTAAVSGTDAVLADGKKISSEQIRTLMSEQPTVANAVGERIISEINEGRESPDLTAAAVDVASNENVDEALRRQVATAASVESTTPDSLWEMGDVEPPEPSAAPGQSAPGQSAPGQSAPGQSAPGQSAPGQSAPGQSAPGQSAPGQSAPGQSAPGQSAPGQSAPGQSAPGQSAPGQSAPGQSAPGQSAPGQSAPGQSAPGQSAPGQPPSVQLGPGTSVEARPPDSTEQPSSEQPSSEQPSTEQPSSEQPSTEQPSSEQPSTEQPSSEQPSSEQPSTEQPSSEQPSTEQPSSEQPSTEQPSSEQPSTEQPTGLNAEQLLAGLADPDPGKRAAYLLKASPEGLSDPNVQSALLEDKSARVQGAYARAGSEHSEQGHQIEATAEWANDWKAHLETQTVQDATSGWDAAVSSPNRETQARAVQHAPLPSLVPLTRRLDDPDLAVSVMVRAMPETSDNEATTAVKQQLRDMVVASAVAGKDAAGAPGAEGSERLATLIDWDGEFTEKYAAAAEHDPDNPAWGRVTSTLASSAVPAARKQKISEAITKNRSVSDDYKKWVAKAAGTKAAGTKAAGTKAAGTKAAAPDRSGGDGGS